MKPWCRHLACIRSAVVLLVMANAASCGRDNSGAVPQTESSLGSEADTGAMEAGGDTDATGAVDVSARVDGDAVSSSVDSNGADAASDALDGMTDGQHKEDGDDGGKGSDGAGDTAAAADVDVVSDADPSPTGICDDGIGPGPKVGTSCQVLGERRCIDLKNFITKVPGIHPSVPIQAEFCSRTYFVECIKNSAGSLTWGPPNGCVSAQKFPESTCAAPVSTRQFNAVHCQASSTGHRCCPALSSIAFCGPKDKGRVLCQPNGAQYWKCASFNELSTVDMGRLHSSQKSKLKACNGMASDCMYWFILANTKSDQLWCIDPKDKPTPGKGYIEPRWVYAKCIQTGANQVKFATTCTENGMYTPPGLPPPGP